MIVQNSFENDIYTKKYFGKKLQQCAMSTHRRIDHEFRQVLLVEGYTLVPVCNLMEIQHCAMSAHRRISVEFRKVLLVQGLIKLESAATM